MPSCALGRGRKLDLHVRVCHVSPVKDCDPPGGSRGENKSMVKQLVDFLAFRAYLDAGAKA